jgi:hypothetical protein
MPGGWGVVAPARWGLHDTLPGISPTISLPISLPIPAHALPLMLHGFNTESASLLY